MEAGNRKATQGSIQGDGNVLDLNSNVDNMHECICQYSFELKQLRLMYFAVYVSIKYEAKTSQASNFNKAE